MEAHEPKITSVGIHRRNIPITCEKRIERSEEMLTRALNLGTTIAMVGAGCSQASMTSEQFPGWSEFTATLARSVIERLSDQRIDIGYDELRQFYAGRLATLADEAPSRHQELRFILGSCKRIARWIDVRCGEAEDEWWYKTIKNRFDLNLQGQNSPVHAALLNLPIHRYITSNYDLVLEEFLSRKRGIDKSAFLGFRSFSQDAEYAGLLATFATGGDAARDMVFHCHGWIEDPRSMIVTEEDYQRWYLSDSTSAGPSFRQTVELLFGSCPLLFVGFSLSDPDLLLALRSISAVEPERKYQRSLFAILDVEGSGLDEIEHLYDQYGVHVLPYDRKKVPLADYLTILKGRWQERRREWLERPCIREPHVPKGKPEYWHYRFDEAKAVSTPGVKLRKYGSRETTTLDDLAKDLATRQIGPRIVVLIGDGGCGKSWAASQLLQKVQEHRYGDEEGRRDPKYFFWSSYYSDDALTGIDRAIAYLSGDTTSSSTVPRLERLTQCLTKPVFVVFDGIERFLRPDIRNRQMGVANNATTTLFFRKLKELSETHPSSGSGGIVILTSRLLPAEKNEDKLISIGVDHGLLRDGPARETGDKRWMVFEVQPMTDTDANEHSELRKLRPDQRSALISLLNGHRYALELAALCLENSNELLVGLADVGPLRRIERMIDIALKRVDGEDRTEFYRLLLERIAVFMGPISDETLNACHALAEPEWKARARNANTVAPQPDEMRDALIQKKLLFKAQSSSDQLQDEASTVGRARYVIHPIVREYIFHRVHHADPHGLPNLSLTGYTAGTAMVDPGRDGVRIVNGLLERLRRDFYERLRTSEPDAVSQAQAQQICEQSFSVLRSRTLANTVPRWGSYQEYIHQLVRLGDMAKAYAQWCKKADKNADKEEPGHAWFWAYRDPRTASDVFSQRGPLFGDELAWLYNELGLAYFEEGSVVDALSIWDQGHEINRIVDNDDSGGQYLFQSYCNLGAANIQFGRLHIAEEYLLRAKDLGLHIGDNDHVPRIRGYLALIWHLRGDLALADIKYQEGLDMLKDMGNSRAESVFLRNYGDLKIQRRDFAGAEQLIRSAYAKAKDAHFPDLVANARLSEGHRLRVTKQYQGAIREYSGCLEMARKHGIRGLEADALSELARLALDLGDLEVARKRAMKSLQIATELQLGLRQTHGLVILGQATVATGQRDLGLAYLRMARTMAIQQQYWLRAKEAEEHLHLLGAPIDPIADARDERAVFRANKQG